jgi:hypothetical protein
MDDGETDVSTILKSTIELLQAITRVAAATTGRSEKRRATNCTMLNRVCRWEYGTAVFYVREERLIFSSCAHHSKIMSLLDPDNI